MLGGLDVETGAVLRVLRRTATGTEAVEKHPEDGRQFRGAPIPALGRNAGRCVARCGVRAVVSFPRVGRGTDNRGPVLIELEGDGGDPIMEQLCFETGLLQGRYLEFAKEAMESPQREKEEGQGATAGAASRQSRAVGDARSRGATTSGRPTCRGGRTPGTGRHLNSRLGGKPTLAASVSRSLRRRRMPLLPTHERWGGTVDSFDYLTLRAITLFRRRYAARRRSRHGTKPIRMFASAVRRGAVRFVYQFLRFVPRLRGGQQAAAVDLQRARFDGDDIPVCQRNSASTERIC